MSWILRCDAVSTANSLRCNGSYCLHRHWRSPKTYMSYRHFWWGILLLFLCLTLYFHSFLSLMLDFLSFFLSPLIFLYFFSVDHVCFTSATSLLLLFLFSRTSEMITFPSLHRNCQLRSYKYAVFTVVFWQCLQHCDPKYPYLFFLWENKLQAFCLFFLFMSFMKK